MGFFDKIHNSVIDNAFKQLSDRTDCEILCKYIPGSVLVDDVPGLSGMVPQCDQKQPTNKHSETDNNKQHSTNITHNSVGLATYSVSVVKSNVDSFWI